MKVFNFDGDKGEIRLEFEDDGDRRGRWTMLRPIGNSTYVEIIGTYSLDRITSTMVEQGATPMAVASVTALWEKHRKAT